MIQTVQIDYGDIGEGVSYGDFNNDYPMVMNWLCSTKCTVHHLIYTHSLAVL